MQVTVAGTVVHSSIINSAQLIGPLVSVLKDKVEAYCSAVHTHCSKVEALSVKVDAHCENAKAICTKVDVLYNRVRDYSEEQESTTLKPGLLERKLGSALPLFQMR
jgi:outer membrane murein-binding lipoprotein Lpp